MKDKKDKFSLNKDRMEPNPQTSFKIGSSQLFQKDVSSDNCIKPVLTKGGKMQFTRAGNFRMDEIGYIKDHHKKPKMFEIPMTFVELDDKTDIELGGDCKQNTDDN